jgi:hypothetical protein
MKMNNTSETTETVTIEIDSAHFYFAHGRSPRGTGGWAFALDPHEREYDKMFWCTPGATFLEAKRQARAHFKALAAANNHGTGILTVYVMS